MDAEVGFYLKQKVPAANGVDVHELPEATMASIMHNGSYQRLPEAYDSLLRWVAENGYQVAGPIPLPKSFQCASFSRPRSANRPLSVATNSYR